MIRDLLTPENHRDPYVWAAVLLAHATICLPLWALASLSLGPWWAVAAVSAAYLILWEGAQLFEALASGASRRAAVADGIVDWIGVTGGIWSAACLTRGDVAAALAGWAALLVVAAVGYWRRDHG